MTTQPRANLVAADKTAKPRPLARRLWRAWLWIINGLALIVAALVFTPAGNWVGARLVWVDPLVKADWIVVLDGDRARGVEAARLYHQGWAPKVIVTSHGPAADDLAAVVRGCGVPPEDIIVDRSATRTCDHPATVGALPGVHPQTDRFLVVTSALHTSRARQCFLHQGYQHVTMRGPCWERGGEFTVAHSGWISGAHDLPIEAYEVLAWGYYKLRGWL
jgi:uncharacterized SAM-binding protein YcdF (DUF218 family)